MNLSRTVAAALIAAGTFAVSTAQAHGIWFAQRATQLSLIYGVGADDLDAVKRLPLINHFAAYDANFKPITGKLRAAGPLVLVDTESPATVLTADMDYGVWSKTPDGEWHKKGRDEVPNAVTSEKTIKYAVTIRGPLTTAIPALPNQTLQVVPVGTTLPDLLNKPLQLRVLFNGKPVAGALVQADYVNDPDNPGVRTAADGTVTLNVRNQGLNVIAATYDGPSDNPAKSDKIEHRATLTFVLAHAPE